MANAIVVIAVIIIMLFAGKGAYKHLKGGRCLLRRRQQAGDSEEEAGWNQAGRENHEDHRHAL